MHKLRTVPVACKENIASHHKIFSGGSVVCKPAGNHPADPPHEQKKWRRCKAPPSLGRKRPRSRHRGEPLCCDAQYADPSTEKQVLFCIIASKFVPWRNRSGPHRKLTPFLCFNRVLHSPRDGLPDRLHARHRLSRTPLTFVQGFGPKFSP